MLEPLGELRHAARSSAHSQRPVDWLQVAPWTHTAGLPTHEGKHTLLPSFNGMHAYPARHEPWSPPGVQLPKQSRFGWVSSPMFTQVALPPQSAVWVHARLQ